MEKASAAPASTPAQPRRRGAKPDRATREVIVKADAPAGSRFKGYATLLVRELTLAAEVIAYRRERWLTPQGRLITAPTPAGIVGGFGPNLRRFCLVMRSGTGDDRAPDVDPQRRRDGDLQASGRASYDRGASTPSSRRIRRS